ncbi:UNVERIFIED_CONTAM: hypothetical protein FKN15_038841 [Acipenser sinensis]
MKVSNFVWLLRPRHCIQSPVSLRKIKDSIKHNPPSASVLTAPTSSQAVIHNPLYHLKLCLLAWFR